MSPRYERLSDEAWLREKYVGEGLSQSDIAEMVGCTQTAVSNRIRQFDIDTRDHKYPELNNPQWLSEQHHSENRGLADIANEVGCTRSAVGYAMRRNDIEVRRNTLVHEVDGRLTDRQREIIEGELLGDGCIPKPRANAGAKFTYGTSRKRYRDWLRDLLENIGFETRSYEYTQDDDRDGWSKTETYRLETLVHFELSDFRKRWYPEGEKIIPPDFELSPLSLRHLHIGDGCFDEGNYSIYLYTDGFETDSLARLQSELREKAGVKSSITHRGSLHIQKAQSRQRYFDYIAPLPPELESVYGYKWP